MPREGIKSFNCLADQELREGIKEYSDWPTIPQLYVKGEFVGGCDIVLSSTYTFSVGSERQSLSADRVPSAPEWRAGEAVGQGRPGTTPGPAGRVDIKTAELHALYHHSSSAGAAAFKSFSVHLWISEQHGQFSSI